jgi:hypothetical protein
VESLVFQQNKGEMIKNPSLLEPLAIPYQVSIGKGFHGFYHDSAQIERENCHHGGGGLTHKVCPFMLTISSFESKYSNHNIHGNSLEATWQSQDYCK